jgi:hypothetical protein
MSLDSFSAALDLLIGYNINLYVGEEVVKGKLLGVESDHLVVENDNKYIFYYNLDKVQAITKNTRLFQGEEPKGNFQKTKSLTELLHSFKNSWVSILSFNKQRFSGVLSDIDTDFATLINGEERILIKLSHVSNILKGFIVEEETKAEAKDEKQQDKKSENDEKKSSEKTAESKEKNNNKSDKKAKSSSKDSSSRSEKKSKQAASEETTEPNQPALIIESEPTMVWSEPIKAETPVESTFDEVTSKTSKVKEAKTEVVVAAPIITTDVKKTSNEMTDHDKKTEAIMITKPKPIVPPKEVKPTAKEEVQTPKAPIQLAKKEVKTVKIQETVIQPIKKETKPQEAVIAVKQETTQNQPSKTTNSKNDIGKNNNMNVWKPQYEEKKVSRFVGEPVTPDAEKKFPFAGWPNRKNRTARNLFF